jgi:carboxymethylenebutenolidase
MGEIVQFKRPDGKTCPGYLATPKSGTGAPGFVCIQEWWGLNDQIKKTADASPRVGYQALEVYAASAKLAWDRTLKLLKIALT